MDTRQICCQNRERRRKNWRKNQEIWRIKQGLETNSTATGSQKLTNIEQNTVAFIYLARMKTTI